MVNMFFLQELNGPRKAMEPSLEPAIDIASGVFELQYTITEKIRLALVTNANLLWEGQKCR